MVRETLGEKILGKGTGNSYFAQKLHPDKLMVRLFHFQNHHNSNTTSHFREERMEIFPLIC